MTVFKKYILPVIITGILSGCYNDKSQELYPAPAIISTVTTTTCDTTNVSFSKTIQPILAQYCAKSGCHDAITRQNGYDMSTYQDAANATFNPKFIPDIKREPNAIPMPNDGTSLSDCQLAQLIAWYNAGSNNN